jgi:putative transposase
VGGRGSERESAADRPRPRVQAPASSPPLSLAKRAGAGRPRKPAKERTFVPHHARPIHKKRHPTHVTLRARKGLPTFRTQRVHDVLHTILERQRRRRYAPDFQVVHYSIQSNHLQRLTGKVWGDRYHSRELTTPREVRNALVNVLQNFRKHGFEQPGPFVDRLTSAVRFAGWSVAITSGDPDPFPPRTPRTWLDAVADRTPRVSDAVRPASPKQPDFPP